MLQQVHEHCVLCWACGVQVLQKSGPRALYYGLGVYCFESWPYDITEVGAAVTGAWLCNHQLLTQSMACMCPLNSGTLVVHVWALTPAQKL
jgi:hypothetical protein